MMMSQGLEWSSAGTWLGSEEGLLAGSLTLIHQLRQVPGAGHPLGLLLPLASCLRLRCNRLLERVL